jgi:glycosyltransferase involved in cell wall biosynthesis
MSELTNHGSAESPRLLLVAHSCRPNAGSELAVGWNRALEAARYFPTWVICDEWFNREEIEKYFAENGVVPNLKFIFVPTTERERRVSRLPTLYYPSYNRWHRRAFKIAEQLHSQHHFDLIHQVNLSGFREPGYTWKLDAPFIWGPLGGAQNFPLRFWRSAGVLGTLGEALRSALNNFQIRCSPRVGKAAKKAAVVLAATSTGARALECRRGSPIDVMLETGVHPRAETLVKDFHHAGPLRILWSGVFEHRKALQLVLEAVAKLPPNVPYELRILGRGALEKRWRKLARRLKVDQHCRWLGWVNHGDVAELYRWADVFTFTSLRDTSGNVVLESFANGTPVVCLDHQGMADIVTGDCGVKLPVTSYTDVINRFSAALTQLHQDRAELERLSRGALARADYYSWRRQGRRMAQVYRAVLQKSKGSPDEDASDSESTKHRGSELIADAATV